MIIFQIDNHIVLLYENSLKQLLRFLVMEHIMNNVYFMQRYEELSAIVADPEPTF